MVLSADAEIMRWPCLPDGRSEEHTSELQSDQISYAVFCLKKKGLRPARRLFAGSPQAASAARAAGAAGAVCNPPRERPVGPAVRREGVGQHLRFFFNVPAPPEISLLSLHDALPI